MHLFNEREEAVTSSSFDNEQIPTQSSTSPLVKLSGKGGNITGCWGSKCICKCISKPLLHLEAAQPPSHVPLNMFFIQEQHIQASVLVLQKWWRKRIQPTGCGGGCFSAKQVDNLLDSEFRNFADESCYQNMPRSTRSGGRVWHILVI